MKGTPAIYNGRIIDKKIFRAFIYGSNGEKKLVESWDEYEAHMQSGIWFSTLEDVAEVKVIPASKPELKPEVELKAKPKSKSKSKMVFEVTDDT